jgi:MFS family permease
MATTAEPSANSGAVFPRVLSRTFQAFRYREFRLLWSGAFISTIGTWMQSVAQSWLVLSMTGSAFYLGLIAFLADLPFMLFALVGGVVADRLDRRKLLLSSQYTQMVCAFTLTALLAGHHLQVWHMMAAVLIAGVAQAFGGPAYMALIPGLVKRQDLPNAIALNSIQFNLARGIGPLLAGAALATVGATLCFALNGFSFIAVIISLYMIRASFVPARTDDSVLAGMRDGFSYVKQRGPLWHLSILGFAAAFCGVPLLTLLPVFARDIFHIGATGYSRMMAVSGAGAIVGALLYASLSHRKGHGRMALRVQIALALLLAVFAVSKNLWLSYAALFLGGVCLIAVFASVTSLVQMATSEEMRGRVMSIFMLAFRSGMPLGNLAIATLAARLSPSIALLVGAVLMCSTALAFLFSSSGVKKL